MTRRKRCAVTTKWCYESSIEALVNAAVRYRNVGRGQTQRAYHCEHCGQYHLTTQSQRSRGSRPA